MGNQPSQPKITAQDKAIFQLKRQRDSLKQYQRKITIVIDKQTALAKAAVQEGKIDKAKVYLRSKKQQQSIIKSTYEQLENLENLIGTIEFTLIEKDVLYGLSQGNEVLKKLNSEMSVEKIDRVMDDLEEEKIKVDEISDMLGSNLTNAEEHEVDEELEALELEVTGQKTKSSQEDMPQKNVTPEMPNVPSEKLREPEAEADSSEEQKTASEPIAA